MQQPQLALLRCLVALVTLVGIGCGQSNGGGSNDETETGTVRVILDVNIEEMNALHSSLGSPFVNSANLHITQLVSGEVDRIRTSHIIPRSEIGSSDVTLFDTRFLDLPPGGYIVRIYASSTAPFPAEMRAQGDLYNFAVPGLPLAFPIVVEEDTTSSVNLFIRVGPAVTP